MKKTFILLLLLVAITNLSAEISVKSFRKLENDLDARVTEPLKDQNGDLCAIIKLVTTQKGFYDFDCGQIGVMKTVQKTAEVWIYVPYGAKRITIKHPQLGVLRDYFFTEPIEKATVYEMILTTGKVITTVDETIATTFLIITSTPSGADVFINEQHKGQTPFQKEMAEGEYTYQIAKDLYYPSAGKINLNTSKDKELIDVQLKPNFGFAQITSKPEDGMTVTLDGKVLEQTTPLKTDTLRSGKHSFSVSKLLFHTETKEINITDNQTNPVEFVLLPAFGSIYIDSKPENGATISIDGKVTNQMTPYKIERIVSGEHTITLRKEWFEPKTIKVKIEDGVDLKQTVEMKPNFGLVNLNSDNESDLFIDNQLKGKGKWEGKLIAGLHTFEAKKAKHHTAIQKIEIEVEDTKQINLKPEPIVGKLKIVTNAIGATVKLNDKDYGTTPLVINDLFAGDYELTIEKENFRKFHKNIVIEEGKTTEIRDSLATGLKVSIESNPLGAQLFIDNKVIGRTPVTFMLNLGNHKVKLINGKKIVEEEINISESGNTSFTYDVNEVVPVILKGSLGNNKVEIDGKYAGEIPFSTKLNIGTHNLKIEKGNDVLEKQINVTTDGKNEFSILSRDFIKSFYKKHFISVSYAYHQTTFANTTFSERIANGSITNDYGHAAAVSYIMYPLEFKVTAFSSGFKAHSLAPFNENAAIKHQGIEVSVNYAPINIGTSIFPYIGAGYQISQLYSAAGTMTIDGSASTNTSMPVLKGGLKVKLGQLFIFGEYKQTFPLNGSTYNSQQLSGGIGWVF
jgi:hypothetical protein